MDNSNVSSGSWSFLPRLLLRSKSFTPEEVRQRLRVDAAGDPRTAAVHAAAERTGVWCSRLPERVTFELGRAAHRLPSVIYWYRQGVPTHEIGRRLSPFGDAWDANRALDVASWLIAQALNQRQVDAPLT